MKRRQFFLFVLMLAGLQLVASPMRACFQDFPDPIQEHAAASDLVLIGTVTGSSSFLPNKADFTIQVEQYFKGMGPDVILVSGFANKGADAGCVANIGIGEHWVFFIKGNPETDEMLRASYDGFSTAIASPTAETIKTITEVTKQAPMPPHLTPFATTVKYWTYSPIFKLGLLIGSLFTVILVGTGISYARRNRRAKPKHR